MRTLILPLWVMLVQPAEACHRFSRWYYPWPQRCSVHVAQAEAHYPLPPSSRPIEDEIEADIPLPSLEGMEFPPDCLADWCERIKAVGVLRQRQLMPSEKQNNNFSERT